ncbi:IS3 family transposase, partial [Pseudomonas capsici]
MARSTFYYQIKVMGTPDKYASVKAAIQRIQDKHRGRLGYRRMGIALRREGFEVNSKPLRRLMEDLSLQCTVRAKKYKSYKGLMGEAAPNILKRQFEADQPNQKLVTDITEFKVAGEKLYLSPVMDLYNAEIVAYQTDTRPRYTLVSTMVEQLLERLPEAAKPLLHSDSKNVLASVPIWSDSHSDRPMMDDLVV